MIKKILGISMLIIGLTSSMSFGLGILDEAAAPLNGKLDNEKVGEKGAEGIKQFEFFIANHLIYPIVILIGTLIAIISFYKVLFSENDDDQKKARQFFVWGILGIMIMTSAMYIGYTLVGESGDNGVIQNNINEGGALAFNIYSKIFMPFLKTIIYLVVGVLFALLIVQCFKYLSDPSEEIQKKSKTIIVWNIIGISVILISKTLVETVYGSQSSVISGNTNLGTVGQGILANQNLGIFYYLINRLMGLISFIILVIIIYQTYLMIAMPDDHDTVKKLKSNIIYIFIGLLLIFGGYVFTHFLLIEPDVLG